MGNPLTTATVKDRIWKRTGLSATELPEPVLDEAITAGLNEFSSALNKAVYGTFPVQNGVEDYPMPTGVEGITFLYYGNDNPGFIGNFSFDDILLSQMQGGSLGTLNFGGNIFESPSLTRIWFSKLKEFSTDISGNADFRVFEGFPATIRLGRVPTLDGVAYYEGIGAWALEEIEPNDQEAFLKACLWKTAEGRAMKLAVAEEYYEYGGIRMKPALTFWEKKAETYRTQFFQDVGFNAGSLIVG